MKKRIAAIFLIVMSCLILCSCENKKVTAADDLISSIGEVTLDSGDDITKAEKAVNELSKKEHEQLKNLKDLENARAVYDDLVAKHNAERVMTSIDKIGENVFLDDENKIRAVRKAYDLCDDKAHEYITNYDKLLKAEESLSKLKVEDVIQKIAAIGTVTLESELDVTEVSIEYNDLTSDEKNKVSNSEVLTNAIKRLDELKNDWQAQEDAKKAEKAAAEKRAAEAQWKDERTINMNGKQVWKVYARGSELHFTGNFRGSGYFGITVLDSNQDFFALVTNEIGDCDIDKSIDGLTPGGMYYIKIECTEGTWSCGWSGTYGQ